MEIVDALSAAGLKCDVWVDGSFLTKKIDPDDIDLVVDVPASITDNPTPAQSALLAALDGQNFKISKHLDSYVMVTAPLGHTLYPVSQISHEQWKKDFGHAYVSRVPKGIAVLEVRP